MVKAGVAVCCDFGSFSLAPGFSRVSATVIEVEPLQRFPGRGKLLKRLNFLARRATRLEPGANEISKLAFSALHAAVWNG